MASEKKRKRPRKPPREAGPNGRQAAFARAYFVGPTRGNATQSARVAGYTGNDDTLSVTGSRLLGNVWVSKELERLRKAAVSRSVASAQATLVMLSQTQRGETLAPLMVRADGTIIYGPPKHADRIQAARLRAQILGELRDSVAVTGADGGPIQHEHEHQHDPPAVARAKLVALFAPQLGVDEAEIHVRRLLGEPPIAASETTTEANGEKP